MRFFKLFADPFYTHSKDDHNENGLHPGGKQKRKGL